MSKYTCKKCGEFETDDLDAFRGHNLRCKPEPEEEKKEPERKPASRRERVPLGVPRRKLAWEHKDPNYVYRVIHNRPNKPNRVNDALQAGYEFVEDERRLGDSDLSNQTRGSVDSRVTAVVGTDEKGNAMTGYLMRIRKDWYDQDQREKQKIVDERERQIFRGVDSQGKPGQDGRYIPTDGGQPVSRIEH